MTNREQTQEEILAELRQFREMMAKQHKSQEKVHGAICNTGAFVKDKAKLWFWGNLIAIPVVLIPGLIWAYCANMEDARREADLRRRQAEFLQKAEELKAQKIAQPLDKKGDS